MHITIVLPYGVFEETNLQYKGYLDRASEHIKHNSSDLVIFCGGYTNKNLPHISEAQSVQDYLQKQDAHFPKHLIEDTSLTTPQNLEFARGLLIQEHITPTELTVICDSIRAPKVFFLSHEYFGKLLKEDVEEKDLYSFLLQEGLAKNLDVTQDVSLDYKTIHIVGVSLGRDKKEIGQQIVATMEEVVFTKYPGLQETFITARKKQWGIPEK